jgi:hypothetical protein
MSNTDTYWTLFVTISWMNGKVIYGYMRMNKSADIPNWEAQIARGISSAAAAQIFMLSPSLTDWKPTMVLLPSETFNTALFQIEEA